MDIITFFETKDYASIISEYIINSSLDFALSNFKDKLNKQEGDEDKPQKKSQHLKSIFEIKAEKRKVENQISTSLIQTYNYTKDISFQDLDTPKSIVEAFVDPDFFPAQRRSQVQNTDPERKNMTEVFHDFSNNLVILGDLGAGKTTLVKKLCQSIFHKDGKYYKDLNFPILIRLREINDFKSEIGSLILIEFLLNRIGLAITDHNKKEFKQPQQSNSYITNLKKYVCEFFEELNILILLDGFDEINDVNVREIILDDLDMLASSFVNSKILITSRTSDFNCNVSNTRTFEIAPLNNKQIDIFIDQYINDTDEARKFRFELLSSPYFDTSRKPLALAHLCAIYERYHKLPEKPKSVYKKIVNLYIEDWDAQRRIDRIKKGVEISEYNNLSNDRKFEFMTKFAYLLTTEFDTSTVFNEKQILRCYEMLYEEFELPFKQAKLIVKEIESHSGLILQSSNETFEFSHKSIHEYLTAEYISRMSHLPRKTALLLKIPNELAIATALSSEPNDFMFTLFIKCLKIKTREASFVNAYLGRLHLEKPDYKLEPTLGYIFAFIYSTLHLGDVNAIKNISYTVYTDNLAKTNELLLKLMNANANVRKSINKILHFYEVTFPYNFSSSNNSDIGLITTLQKRFDIPHYLDYKRLKNQPENIVVPAFFIKTTPNPRQR